MSPNSNYPDTGESGETYDVEQTFVLKDLNKAFPIYAKDWSVNIGLALKKLQDLSVSAGADIKSNIEQLYSVLTK